MFYRVSPSYADYARKKSRPTPVVLLLSPYKRPNRPNKPRVYRVKAYLLYVDTIPLWSGAYVRCSTCVNEKGSIVTIPCLQTESCVVGTYSTDLVCIELLLVGVRASIVSAHDLQTDRTTRAIPLWWLLIQTPIARCMSVEHARPTGKQKKLPSKKTDHIAVPIVSGSPKTDLDPRSSTLG